MRSRLQFVTFGIALLSMTLFASPSLAQNKLDRKIPESKLNGNSLADVLDFIADVSDINMHVDWHALEAAGISKDTPVDTRVRDITVRKALKTILDGAAGAGKLTFYFDQGVLEITTQEVADQQLITRIYPIEDLLFEPTQYDDAPTFTLTNIGQGSTGGGSQLFGASGGNAGSNVQAGTSRTERVAAIISMITSTVRPDVWKEAGGNSTINYTRGCLIVTAPRSVHDLLSDTWR